MVVATFLFPEPLKAGAETLVWESWREPLRSRAGGSRLANYRIVSLLICAVFIGLYFIFR
jgi:hypothetical protein